MDSLLKHMVDMTGHRDHSMLDISVLAAVQELSGARRTRVLTIGAVRGRKFVRARAVAIPGQPPRMEDGPEPGLPGDPLEHFPALANCIANREACAELVEADGSMLLWMPIWIGDKLDTVLEIHMPEKCDPDRVQMILGIVAVYRNFQNLLDYSERDSLTGLLNRKTFDDQLSKMLQTSAEELNLPGAPERRHHSEQEKNWLAVVDVDHFKAVNDRFGHLYGDEVLILIANLLTSSFRAQDRVFRFGGEEFVVLLRSTSLENARKIIERFRKNVESHVFPQVGKVTVSVGFVTVSAYESPVATLGRADQALYYAKSHGRNQACHYDDLVQTGELQSAASNDTAEFF
ncbi:GGDEF domain-containing protein [Massilia sp. TS11]|uniref:GGDEF domain-containing protein n=1 Tax=Massilia sp. TS11 TaxID=2908003 RepID=UPI001EDC8FDF|nr:GGDEF domain-containing protein [Massilia sp. TS11]MCG2585803.1 GGDEF domain-containing protein [Massilia sp. TS11]